LDVDLSLSPIEDQEGAVTKSDDGSPRWQRLDHNLVGTSVTVTGSLPHGGCTGECRCACTHESFDRLIGDFMWMHEVRLTDGPTGIR
jgi:hypothetical protein